MTRLFGEGNIKFTSDETAMEGFFVVMGEVRTTEFMIELLTQENNQEVFDSDALTIATELVANGSKMDRTLFNIALTSINQAPIVFFKLYETSGDGAYPIVKQHLSPTNVPNLINIIKTSITELDVIPVISLIVTKINDNPDIGKDSLIKFLSVISAITENVIFSSAHNRLLEEVTNVQDQIRGRIIHITQKQPTKPIRLNVEGLKELTIDFDYSAIDKWQTVVDSESIKPVVDIKSLTVAEKAPVKEVAQHTEPEGEEGEEEEEEEEAPKVVQKAEVTPPTITLGANNPIITIIEGILPKQVTSVVKEKVNTPTVGAVKSSPILLVKAMPYNAPIRSVMELRVIKTNMEYILEKGGASHYALIGKFNDNGTNRVLDMLHKSLIEITSEIQETSGCFVSPVAFTEFFEELFRNNKWLIIYGISTH